jgi:hypothetical protein
MLKCKNEKCQRDFYAGIETTEDRFPKLDLLPGRETCPHCNEILIYDVPDFFLERP